MYQREFDKRARIGLVGVGSHAYRNLLPALHYLPAELVAMTSRSGGDKLKRTAAEYGCRAYATAREMYENEHLDGVIISVSPQMHPELALDALSHGVSVFMEKPPAMRARQIEELIEARGDKVVSVGFKKAFTPGALKAREIIGSGAFAPLQSLLGIYPMTLPENGQTVLDNGAFTNWLGNGCHPLSMLLSCAGPAKRLCAHRMSNGQGMVAFEFASGAFGNLHLAQEPAPIESYHFYGGAWRLSVENTDRVTLDKGIPFEYAYTDNFAPMGFESGSITWTPQNCLATLENKSLFVQGMVGELAEFLSAVLGEGETRFTSLEFALQVMRAYEAVLLSEGQWMELSAT